MAEPIPHVDDAAAYVLGTLGSRDRRRFEARLKKSPELQRVVRLLEAGSIGLAMASPHREPPIRLWAGIQAAVTHECEKRGRSARRRWLRNVAGIAACALAGWFAYTSWNHRATSATPTAVIASDVVETTGSATNSVAAVMARATSQVTNLASQPSRERRSLRPGESATLRQRVGDLEDQVAHLAQTVTQQAAPPDLNRLTFVNIAPEGLDGTTSPQVVAQSPELRRALLLGVARQLGWMPPSPASLQSPASPAPSTPSADPNPPAPQNDMGVEFVDLPPAPVDVPSPETETASVEKPQSPPVATTSTSAPEESTSRNTASIPAFVSGTNLVFAVDSSLVPIGTEAINLYSGSAGGSTAFRGTVWLGNRPTVVTMPFSAILMYGDNNNNRGLTGSGPGAITFNSVSIGSLTTINFTYGLSASSSP